jgi:DNA-3-methyladenine glycosylase II
LKERDPDIAGVLSRFGPPPMWRRKAGFESLVNIILEQQVSLASARAAFDRLRLAVPGLTPQTFLNLDAKTLRKIGFSRQKAGYCRNLAEAVSSGRLPLEALERMDDDRVRSELTSISGIGHWTADVYLLMALRRPDVWPIGDLALATAVQQVKRLHERPSSIELAKIGEIWKPWRAVAARVFWHHYLSRT